MYQQVHQGFQKSPNYINSFDGHKYAMNLNTLRSALGKMEKQSFNTNSQLASKQDKRQQYNYQNNDYSNNYIHTQQLPVGYIRNVENPVSGYPKLQRLLELKEQNNQAYFAKPLGCRVDPNDMVQVLNKWIHEHHLLFDTIMIGSLTENQFVLPILTQLPIDKLCSKPGFLYIWGSAHKMNEMTSLLSGASDEYSNGDTPWTRKFRRSEELVFTTGDDNVILDPRQDDESLFIRKQWHCCMCITGTVRRAVDGHLINCNINTDLNIESKTEKSNPSSVPDAMYKVAENFSSGNRRLHIIPSRSGHTPVRLRKGWVIMSPDVLLDNFDPEWYKEEIKQRGYNVPQSSEIEYLRPKSPLKN